ncbi:hypothetical protein V1517DRAFT_319021, partial [Lipomyces orientalis]
MPLRCANMRQPEVMRRGLAVQSSCEAVRSYRLPTVGRSVENRMRINLRRSYYFGWSNKSIGHRLLDADREQYRGFWRVWKTRKVNLQNVEFIRPTDGSSRFVERNLFSKLTGQVSPKVQHCKPYIVRNSLNSDLGPFDYMAEYFAARSVHESRKQDAKRTTPTGKTRTSDEAQIPPVASSTTVLRQYDGNSGQAPISTVREHYTELFAPDKQSRSGNTIVDRFCKHLLDVDHPFPHAIDVASEVKRAAPEMNAKGEGYTMFPRLWPLAARCTLTSHREKGATKDVTSSLTPEPELFSGTVGKARSDGPVSVDDVTLAGGPLYLAKLHDAKKDKGSVVQQEFTDNSPANHANCGPQAQSVRVSKAYEAMPDGSVAAAEQSSRSITDREVTSSRDVNKAPVASADNIAQTDGVDAAKLESAAVEETNASEKARDDAEGLAGEVAPEPAPESTGERALYETSESVPAADAEQATGYADQATTSSETLITEYAGKFEGNAASESRTSNFDVQLREKLDSVVRSQAELEKRVESLRSDYYWLNDTQEDYSSQIGELRDSIESTDLHLRRMAKDYSLSDNQSKLAAAIEAAVNKELKSMNIEIKEGVVPTLGEGEHSGRPPQDDGIEAAVNDKQRPRDEKAIEQSTEMLVITPARSEVHTKVAPELANQMFPLPPASAFDALGQLSRSQASRVRALTKQGWVLVSAARNGSLVFQKRPRGAMTSARRAAKVLSGAVLVSSVILTVLVGYGYTTM